MSHPVNEQIKEAILDEVESMTISDFQNAVDKFKISGQTVVDEMVENLVEFKFLNKEEYVMGAVKNYMMDIEEEVFSIDGIEEKFSEGFEHVSEVQTFVIDKLDFSRLVGIKISQKMLVLTQWNEGLRSMIKELLMSALTLMIFVSHMFYDASLGAKQFKHQEAFCLAQNVYHNLRKSTRTIGQMAVMSVTINRVNDERFPNTICEVVYEEFSRPSWKGTGEMIPIRLSFVSSNGTVMVKVTLHTIKKHLMRFSLE